MCERGRSLFNTIETDFFKINKVIVGVVDVVDSIMTYHTNGPEFASRSYKLPKVKLFILIFKK